MILGRVAPDSKHAYRAQSPPRCRRQNSLIARVAFPGVVLAVGCGMQAGDSPPTPVAYAAASSASGQPVLRAQAEATHAQTLANRVKTEWTAAQSADTLVATRSALTSARKPGSPSLVPALTTLQGAIVAIRATLPGAQQALSETIQNLAAAQASGATSTALSQAHALIRAARQSVATAENREAQVVAWTQKARAAVTLWVQIHNAPPGYLGVVGTNPTAGFGVGGCEIVTALSGTPAATAGLVGSTQRTDPMGDTIYRLVDLTDGGAVWPIPSCQALDAAMTQTRPGDLVQVDYYHRDAVWYLLAGVWEPRTVQVEVGRSACRAAVSAPIVDTRLRVTVRLIGPDGSATTPAIMDTGGADGWFDAGLLNRLGFTPIPGTEFDAAGFLGAPSGTVGYLYRIPLPAIEDDGQFVSLGQGTLTVQGIVGLFSWAPRPGFRQDSARRP